MILRYGKGSLPCSILLCRNRRHRYSVIIQHHISSNQKVARLFKHSWNGQPVNADVAGNRHKLRLLLCGFVRFLFHDLNGLWLFEMLVCFVLFSQKEISEVKPCGSIGGCCPALQKV